MVKKVTSGGCFKIVHEKFRAKGVNPISASEAAAQKKIGDDYSELKPYLVKSQEMLTPMRAHELIKLISEDDMTLLWMNEVRSALGENCFLPAITCSDVGGNILQLLMHFYFECFATVVHICFVFVAFW